MKIHKEGYTSLFFTLIFIVGLVILINVIWPLHTLWHTVAYVTFGVFFLIVLQFFRSPMRKVEMNLNQVLSPADGKVVVIEKTFETEYLKSECLQVSIFMSPVNVHSNRYPVSGEVKYVKYHPGKYLVAWHPKSSTDNERNTIVIHHPQKGNILVRQIAGALARRIVCYSKEGEMVTQGTEMGFIKFGSRVDVFLPLESDVKVKIGEEVKGGLSVLAFLNPDE
ncbi:MAG: phosphatidylserine decarboxylase family protein [Bacteroidota bacterium]